MNNPDFTDFGLAHDLSYKAVLLPTGTCTCAEVTPMQPAEASQSTAWKYTKTKLFRNKRARSFSLIVHFARGLVARDSRTCRVHSDTFEVRDFPKFKRFRWVSM